MLTIDVVHAVKLAIEEILAPVGLASFDMDLVRDYVLSAALIHHDKLALP